MLVFLLSAFASAVEPGDHFQYALEREVRGTSGVYLGYSDRTRSLGKYELRSAHTDDTFEFSAVYDWRYTSSEPRDNAGRTERISRFGISDRRYQSAIDLDDAEWVGVAPESLAIWFWIPPDVEEGDSLRILDRDFQVISRSSTVTSLGVTRPGIELFATGNKLRKDAYGEMSVEWTDTWYFDPTSGYVLAERYKEEDSGHLDGASGGFTLTDTVDVYAATYLTTPAQPPAWELKPPPVWWLFGPRAFAAAGFFGAAGITLLIPVTLLVGLLFFLRSLMPPKSMNTQAYGKVAFAPLASPAHLTQWPEVLATEHFGPFLEDFAIKALDSGDPVFVATAGKRLVGIALRDTEAQIGTVLAPDTAVAQGLRKWINSTEFFSETRHKVGTGFAFNVYETYKIVRLDAFPEVSAPSGLVRRMKPEDQLRLAAIAQEVYATRVSTWLGAQIKAGDLAYVAEVDGVIVGFAFATVAGDQGRLHSLTVLASHRDRGIGRELIAARLKGLEALGVTRVISEIADWNVASLHLAYGFGFKDVGAMWVETTQTMRAPRSILRR